MAKTKNKKKFALADKVQNRRKQDATKKKLNPFEVHINKEKIKVLGKKSKHEKGLPGVSRAKAMQKRKETLGVEMKLMNKSNAFIDRRIGEKDNQLSAEDRMIARFAAERVKQHSKKNIFNLADDEILTHRGQTLEQIEKFDDPRSDDEDEEGRGFGGLTDDFVSEGHFGGGMLSKTESKDGAKSHKDLIEQLIAESKKRKAEKQKEKEQTLDLTEKLDSEWKDLQPVVFKKAKVEAEPGGSIIDKVLSQAEKKGEDYDKMMRELRFEKRGTPSDGLKNDEKASREEREQLERWERERRDRMMMETPSGGPQQANRKHRSAEDLDDNFDLEDEKEFMLAYDKNGKPLVPENILKDFSVPNAKQKFDDGISDTSSSEGENEDESVSENDSNESESESQTKINGDVNNEKNVSILFQNPNFHENSDSEKSDESESGSNELKTLKDSSKTKNVAQKTKTDTSDEEKQSDESEANEPKTLKDSSKTKNVTQKTKTDTSDEEKQSDESEANEPKTLKDSSKTKNVTQKTKTDNSDKESESDENESEADEQKPLKDSSKTKNVTQKLKTDTSEEGSESENEIQEKVKEKQERSNFTQSKTENKHESKSNDQEDKEESSDEESDGNKEEETENDSETEIIESESQSNKNKAPKIDDFNDLRDSDSESDSEVEMDDNNEIASFFDKNNLGEKTFNLKQLLSNKTPAEQTVALQKLIKNHDPSKGENNKELLSKLFAHLLQYTNDIFTNIKDEGTLLKAFLTFDRLVPHFYDLAKINKVSTKKFLVELLIEKRDTFKRNKKRIPDLDTLIFFKLVSLLYPTSDFRHPVTTPSLIFMSEILTTSKFNDAYSVSRGLFLTSLTLEYTVLSKRLVPSAINFLRGILYLSAHTTILNPIQLVPPFKTNAEKILNLERDCSKMEVDTKMAAKDLVLPEIDENFKIRSFLTCTVMLKELFDNFNDIESQSCLFEPHIKLLNKVDLENYPKKVRSIVAGILKEMKNSLETKTFTPLCKEKARPKALRLYEPDIQEVFTGSKSSKLSREKAEQQRLKSKYKREMKGALREIRRDKSYIASVKIRQKIHSDNVRKEKVKQIYKDASIQQGELNKLQRMK